MRPSVRGFGAFTLVVAAVAVWFALAPAPLDAKDHTSNVEAILAMSEANNDSAKGAAQQEVVNGWATRDLLALLVNQADELAAEARDQRPAAFLGLLVLGAALALVTTGTIAASPAAPETTGAPTV